MVIHNCHIHTFTSKAVPDRTLPLRVVQLTRSRVGAAIARGILRLLPFRRFDRLAAFVGIGNKSSQAEIVQEAMRYYPADTRFVVLAMDFEFMKAGKSSQSYEKQLAELRELKVQYGDRILPFVAADPRRPEVFRVVREHLEEHEFAGIKIYPPLGYYPVDEGLREVYEYAQENGVPVLAHCSRGGVYYKGRIKPEMRRHPRTGEIFKERKNKAFTDHYTDPRNYKYVLEEFPELKICLAHYGGVEEWKKYLRDPWPSEDLEESWLSLISELIRKHPNVYTDISFTASEKRFWPLAKVLLNTESLQDRILFGSDFYMVRIKAKERVFAVELRAAVGEPEFRRMAEANARAFLSWKHV